MFKLQQGETNSGTIANNDFISHSVSLRIKTIMPEDPHKIMQTQMSHSIKKGAVDLDLAQSLIDRPDFLT